MTTQIKLEEHRVIPTAERVRSGSDILIIIPAYNEEEVISRTVQSLVDTVGYDYIVINDGSKDNTRKILKDHNFNHIDLPINLGIGGAMQTGYKFALRNGYKYAIQLDADGQHNPKDIEILVNEIHNNDYDMVVGSRFVQVSAYKGSIFRRMGIYYFYLLLRLLTGIKVTDPTSGYRIANHKVIAEFSEHYPTDYPEVEVIVTLAKKKYRIKEVSVDMSPRQGGQSSITPIRSFYYMAKVSLFALIRWCFE